jgi:hypothetical protein
VKTVQPVNLTGWTMNELMKVSPQRRHQGSVHSPISARHCPLQHSELSIHGADAPPPHGKQ